MCNPPRPCVSRITVTLTICSHGYLAHEEQATCGVSVKPEIWKQCYLGHWPGGSIRLQVLCVSQQSDLKGVDMISEYLW